MTKDIQNIKCPICETLAQLYPILGDNEHYVCPECGDYKISGTALTLLKNRPLNELERNRVSLAIRSLPRQTGPHIILYCFIEEARREY